MEFLGIDFSGNARSWGAGRATSNVWIAQMKFNHVDRHAEFPRQLSIALTSFQCRKKIGLSGRAASR
jgi:hypothetical protein